jgi:DNA repair photolyase
MVHAARAGAVRAGYMLLRLPLELEVLFGEWLDDHYPLKAAHVWSLIRQMRAGKAYQSGFDVRQTGTGPYADMIRQRFQLALKRHRLTASSLDELNLTAFIPPQPDTPQLSLF